MKYPSPDNRLSLTVDYLTDDKLTPYVVACWCCGARWEVHIIDLEHLHCHKCGEIGEIERE